MPKHPPAHAPNPAVPAAFAYREALRQLRSLAIDDFSRFDPCSGGVFVPVRVVSRDRPTP